MRAKLLRRGLAVTLLWLMVSSVSAIEFDDLLRKADAIRSADPQHFNRILEQLDNSAERATPAQREQLQFLHAYRLIFSGNPQGAILELKRLLAITKDPVLQYRARGVLINTYAVTREFTEGLSVLDQLLATQASIADREIRHQGLLAAGVLYNQVGQYDLSQRYAEMVLDDSASSRSQCFAGNLRVEALLKLSKPASDASILAMIQQCRIENEHIVAGAGRTYLSRKWAAEGRIGDAITELQDHISEMEATRYPRLMGEAHSLLAEHHLINGDVEAAERHAKRALDHGAGKAYPLLAVSAHKTLYDIALRRNDVASALEQYRRYSEADKAHLNDVKARELAFQLARHETFNKTQQIELLNRENQVLQLQQSKEKLSKQNTQLIAALLALLVASIGYWAYKIKRMQVSFRRLAETDALTGISNRHHFTRQAEEALTYCAKTGEDVGLIMFDLDHFKLINDQHGHVAGDCVLKRVAEACRSVCRKNDRFGRVGGEEFALLLVGCDLAAATQMARNCCARIAEICTAECGASFPVTASFGVTTAKQSGYDLTRLMSHADQMLYRSKHDGRNRVSTYDAAVIDRPEAQATQSA